MIHTVLVVWTRGFFEQSQSVAIMNLCISKRWGNLTSSKMILVNFSVMSCLVCKLSSSLTLNVCYAKGGSFWMKRYEDIGDP